MYSGATRSISSYDEIRVDASTSRSPDDVNANLTYAWTCMEYSPTMGGPCGTLSGDLPPVPVLIIPGTNTHYI